MYLFFTRSNLPAYTSFAYNEIVKFVFFSSFGFLCSPFISQNPIHRMYYISNVYVFCYLLFIQYRIYFPSFKIINYLIDFVILMSICHSSLNIIFYNNICRHTCCRLVAQMKNKKMK